MCPARFLPCITASAAAPGAAAKSKWFEIKAVAEGAELRLRGYVGGSSTWVDYYGNEHASGGMGTLQEFEAALLALGDVPLITVYLTSEGGDFPTAIAISSILARQKARIVCVIDGYAYSAAPVIACAADEVRAAKNALLMIHDAEYWSSGCDVASLEQAIATLQACNDSMAAAFVNKAGGTTDEWKARMFATTWMTGAQAAELKLVDVLLDEVALSAYAPLKSITAALRPPAEIKALIDTAASPASPTKPQTPPSPTAMLRPRTPLFTAATDAPAGGGGSPAPSPAAAPAAAPLTLEMITGAVGTVVTAAMKPLEEKIAAAEGQIKHLQGLKDHGLGGASPASPTAAAAVPIAGAPQTGAPPPVDYSKLTAAGAIAVARQARATGAVKS